MFRNLDNICRVCLNSGSRNIFEKTNSQFSLLTSTENVSSFDRLLEKLRYVTMLKIDENENLPKCICDSCIIQLNVAYNLKKAAVQSDIKLRQYVIEYGVNVTSYTTCINTVSIVRPPGILMPSNSSSSPSITTTTTSAIVTTEKQTTTTSEPAERTPFAVMPMVIKEEPVDYEAMSDITIETNTDAFDDNGTNEMLRPLNTATIPIIARQKERRITPLVSSLMVAVNDKSLLASSSTSDVDYINAYMQTPSSAGDESPAESTSPARATAPKPPTSSTTAAAPTSSSANQTQAKATESSRDEQESSLNKAIASSKNQTKKQQKPRKKSRELRMLQINLKKVSNVVVSDTVRRSRTSMGTIEAKTYCETKKYTGKGKPNQKRSIESIVVGGKSLRERSSSQSTPTPTRGLQRKPGRGVIRRKSVRPSDARKMAHSLRQRSSL